mgnify:FL=1
MKPKRRFRKLKRRNNFPKGRFILQRESVLIFRGVFLNVECSFGSFALRLSKSFTFADANKERIDI